MARRIGLIASARQWRDRGRVTGFPHRHLADGLKRIGCEPVVVANCGWPLFDGPVDAAFLWNGAKGRLAHYAQQLRMQGIIVFLMEHGWIDRRRHVQIDHEGFSHAASWATRKYFDSPAPAEGRQRFRRAFGRPPMLVRSAKARKGYILVLLQVPGDSQLYDSETDSPAELVRAVEAAAPDGWQIRVRSHPLHDWICDTKGGAVAAVGTLQEAIGDAAFCVTINSTAGIESLAMGCPVLCLGPAMYAAAGAALHTNFADMAVNLAKMIAGWRPTTKVVHNFLYHLACRQWTFDEMAEGSVLQRLLDLAGHRRTGAAGLPL